MKKLLVLVAIFALSSTAMAANFDGDDASRSGYIGTYTLYPGDTFSYNGVLDDTWPTDWEGYGFIAVGSGVFGATVEDCCILGDTMIILLKDFLAGAWVSYDYCTSPCVAAVRTEVAAPYGVYLVLVGYLDSPGGFPAGFTTNAFFN